MRREPRVTQIQVATLVVLATLLEYSASPLLGLYTYRLHNVPAFVPPGPWPRVPRGGARRARRPPSRAARSLPLLVLAVATAWAVGGLLLPVHPDTLGFVLFLSFAALHPARPLRRASTPPAFVLTAALELYGTRLGTWAWAPHDPTGLLSAANPPSGIPGGYCWLDFWALLLAPSVLPRCSCARGRRSCGLRPAPAAPS